LPDEATLKCPTRLDASRRIDPFDVNQIRANQVIFTHNRRGHMNLPTVKANVKAWEKAFRAKEGRAPTKDDIKSDTSGISAF